MTAGMQHSSGSLAISDTESCGLDNCGICTSGGKDYRGMRWVPEPVLTRYGRYEQSRSLSWWHTDKQTLLEALTWAGP